MEELQQGLQVVSASAPGTSTSSTALAATPPPRPSTPSSSSLLGSPPGPSGVGGGGRGGRRRRGGGRGAGRGTNTTPTPQRGAPWPSLHNHGQGASPCGRSIPVVSHAWRPCSLVLPRVPLSDLVGSLSKRIHRFLVAYSTRHLARACRLGPGSLGPLLQHHSLVTTCWAGVGH